jgi:murein DD-endopeptidase MepM/ murein hydrolase activator NlpD
VQPRPQDGRYQGRRRVPTPPRSRYAAVVTTAIVGAGVVALGASVMIPEPKAAGASYDGDSASLSALGIEDRQAAQDRAARSEDRPGPATTVEQAAPDVWLLPLHVQYQITTLYEMRWGEMHYGVDLAVPYGTPYYAIHSGTVILSRYYGGCGMAIQIQHDDGTVSQYCHGSKLLVQEGQKVKAGDNIGLVGNTGQSYGDHLHIEIHVNDAPTDPIAFLLARGVDIPKRLEAASGGIVIS